MEDDDFEMPVKAWNTSPPYWDQKMGKRLKGDWKFFFLQVDADGTETYHYGPKEPMRVSTLRVGRLGDIEQTATWDNYAAPGLKPAVPPGVGWTLHRQCNGFCLWRREVLVKVD